MAQIVENKKGFKVIQISRKELIDMFGQHGNVGICGGCRKEADIGFYVAILNSWLCPHCYKEWYNKVYNHEYYKQYENLENSNFNFYKYILDIQQQD